MQTFIYNEEKSHKENYSVWATLNRKERECWGEEVLTSEASKNLFNSYYPQQCQLLTGSAVWNI
jgi:hypothetical protein